MKEFFINRKLIWKLAKNDFKKRYAGSYLGAAWATVQPIVTVLMYWFVFDHLGFMRGGADVPYVLFLTAGLVPWFFFNEALTNGTTAFLEYNYLVKKVVFNIRILPMIRVLAATFIHAFFLLVLILVACVYGYYPSVYTLQVFYYSISLFILTLAICYTTASVVVYFRDLSQIIQILLQIGMWATPVLWNLSQVSPKWQMILKINPLVYIVEGYRGAIYGKMAFWEMGWYNLYFWGITLLLFLFGNWVYKRLRPNFADIL